MRAVSDKTTDSLALAREVAEEIDRTTAYVDQVVGEILGEHRPTLTLVTDDDVDDVASTAAPTLEEMTEALRSPGLLRDHPVTKRIMARRAAEIEAQTPKLALIEGGRSDG